jgi:hypothetical protein
VVNVPKLLVKVEGTLDLGWRQHARDVGVRGQQRLEISMFVSRPHGAARTHA